MLLVLFEPLLLFLLVMFFLALPGGQNSRNFRGFRRVLPKSAVPGVRAVSQGRRSVSAASRGATMLALRS